MDCHCCEMEFARTPGLFKDTLEKQNSDEESELPATDMSCVWIAGLWPGHENRATSSSGFSAFQPIRPLGD